ncbi:MAG: SUMF1/EgtB/PvdO family nonheme iron enzyme [Planctomycetes bacterium]|nr:SUMF1/EgtB/PvdO family nonheme iron enzyme [Planctomycetota bacterium]
MIVARGVARAAVVAALVCLAMASAALAAVNIETVPVGNTGNTPDNTGYGAVDYDFNIGKYEVTAGQYTAFLNAVAVTDAYGLYNTSMWSSAYGCKIERTDTGSGYSYSVASDWAKRPVNFVSFWDACRFANWLHNGQPTDDQGPGTTESGAYTLDGYNGMAGQDIQRNTDWQWAVTSEDEWYKAAYHKNDGDTGNYFDYPTASDSVPSNDLTTPDSGNNANFYDNGYTIDSPYYRTEAGEFELSESPYNTFDQGGNVWECNEAAAYEGDGGSYRGIRGGSFYYTDDYLLASFRSYYDPTGGDDLVGFRVVAVPEPATMSLLALAGLGMLARRRSGRG